MPSAIAKDSIQVGSFTWYYRHIQPATSNDKPPVLLLLHGLPAQSHTWRGLLPALGEAGFRAIAPDWLGFGFSDKPDKRDFAYTPAAYQQVLAAWQIERCSLFVGWVDEGNSTPTLVVVGFRASTQPTLEMCQAVRVQSYRSILAIVDK